MTPLTTTFVIITAITQGLISEKSVSNFFDVPHISCFPTVYNAFEDALFFLLRLYDRGYVVGNFNNVPIEGQWLARRFLQAACVCLVLLYVHDLHVNSWCRIAQLIYCEACFRAMHLSFPWRHAIVPNQLIATFAFTCGEEMRWKYRTKCRR